MKKSTIFYLLLFPILLFSQESEPAREQSIFEKKHEVKMGTVKLLSGSIFEATYEYIHSKDFTYGSSILINFDSNSSYPENFSITPFARMYFQESQEYGAKGFFVEGFAKYLSGKNIDIFSDKSKYATASVGLSLGKKWINSSGFVFEALVGVGRNLNKVENIPSASFRGDLFIGYRF